MIADVQPGDLPGIESLTYHAFHISKVLKASFPEFEEVKAEQLSDSIIFLACIIEYSKAIGAWISFSLTDVTAQIWKGDWLSLIDPTGTLIRFRRCGLIEKDVKRHYYKLSKKGMELVTRIMPT